MCECVYVCETRIETEERQRGIQEEGGREGGGEERRGGGGEREKLLRVVAFFHVVPGLNSDH